MSNDHDTHTLAITDILQARRLTESGVVLDAQIRSTSAGDGLNSALLASMMPHTSRHTLVARVDQQRVVGQFYVTQNTSIARIVYLAPNPTPQKHGDDSAWLLMLDAMTAEAGKRGAHILTGEVDENSPLFVTMRQSRFAVYARQTLFGCEQGSDVFAQNPQPELTVQRATEDHTGGIYALYRRTTPRLLQQVEPPPSMNGFVYLENGRVLAFINVAEGRDGVFFKPYVDPAVLPEAGEIVLAVAAQIHRAGRRSFTLRVARHQGWLMTPFEEIGFKRAAEQAVMVRHIAAGVHSPGFTSLQQKYAAQSVKRQTGELPELCIDIAPQRQRITRWRQINYSQIGTEHHKFTT